MKRSVRPDLPRGQREDFRNLRKLMPYLMEFRGRVLLALGALLAAKLAGIGVPLILKGIVDALDEPETAMVALPVGLLLAYGVLRLANTVFSELRDMLFARVRYRAMRRLTTRTLAHLHNLSLRFHLERKTGAISRDLERGARSLSTLLNYLTFSVLPLVLELLLVIGILLASYAWWFAAIMLGAVIVYVAFTLAVSGWRLEVRHTMNRLESQANTEAIDGLVNYETVKYFGNERFEVERCDRTLAEWERASVLSQGSMSALNAGQGAIIAVTMAALMALAAGQVAAGAMTLGDLVLVNAFLLQLFIPLNFLGVVYRQTRYALADMDNLVRLLEEVPEVSDAPHATALPPGPGRVHFDNVHFAYTPDRPILHGVDVIIEPGRKLAVVGASGAGKSTLARLLFRFYDVQQGAVRIDGHDVRDCTLDSVHSAIGIVPQDTVLFNESLYFNLSYARPDAPRAEVEAAARMAQLGPFIDSLPQGYDTLVGERGLKLSGGEKQRVAIARAILKRPRILIFDEATSALDSHSEQAILLALREAAANHTTLVIAHRLSTVVDADTIIVLEHGRVVEQGDHASLLAMQGRYARLWTLQQQRQADEPGRLLDESPGLARV